MTTETTKPRSLGAVMSSEAGYEPGVDDSPLRVSGFVALILALLSGFSIVALPMVGFSIAAVLFGLFALRKSDSKSIPVGTTAARVAILLAVLFGTWGAGRFTLKQKTLGDQAEYFARQFLRVAANGDEIYAKELQKSHVNRFLKTMPLEQSYELQRLASARRAKEAMRAGGYEDGDMDSSPYEEEEESLLPELKKYTPDHPWVLYRPVRVYNHYGRNMAQVVLASDNSEKAYKVMFVLEYLFHKERGSIEWYVETCTMFRKPIVAESVL